MAGMKDSIGDVLVLYDAAKAALAHCVRVDEVKSIRDKAVALEVYAKQVKDSELIDHAIEIRLRAERRAGEILRSMEKANGGQVGGRLKKDGTREEPSNRPQTLQELSITKKQSSRWQNLAGLNDSAFEKVIEDAKTRICAVAVDVGKPKRSRLPNPVPLKNDVGSERLRILVGDNMVRLKEIPDESVDCVVTSPPYYHTMVYPGAFTTFGQDCEHDWKMSSKHIKGYLRLGVTTGLNSLAKRSACAHDWMMNRKIIRNLDREAKTTHLNGSRLPLLTDADKTIEHGT